MRNIDIIYLHQRSEKYVFLINHRLVNKNKEYSWSKIYRVDCTNVFSSVNYLLSLISDDMELPKEDISIEVFLHNCHNLLQYPKDLVAEDLFSDYCSMYENCTNVHFFIENERERSMFNHEIKKGS